MSCQAPEAPEPKKPLKLLEFDPKILKAIVLLCELDEIFTLSLCSKKTKSLITPLQIPTELTWSFCSNWSAFITITSYHRPPLLITLQPVSQEKLQECQSQGRYSYQLINGAKVLLGSVIQPRINVYSENEQDWKASSRGCSEHLLGLFSIEHFTLKSVNYDPEEVIFYLKLAPIRFKHLEISYPETFFDASSLMALRVKKPASPIQEIAPETPGRSRIQSTISSLSEGVWNLLGWKEEAVEEVEVEEEARRIQNPLILDRDKINQLLNYLLEEVGVEDTWKLDFS